MEQGWEQSRQPSLELSRALDLEDSVQWFESAQVLYNDYNIQIGNRHTFFLSKQAPKALESLRSF